MPKKSYELVLNTMGQNRTQGFAILLQLRRDNHVYSAGSWQLAWQQTRLVVCPALTLTLTRTAAQRSKRILGATFLWPHSDRGEF